MTCIGMHTLLVSFNRRTATLTRVGRPCLWSLPAVKVHGHLQFSGVSRNQVLDLSPTPCVCVSLSLFLSLPLLRLYFPPSLRLCVSLSLTISLYLCQSLTISLSMYLYGR